MSKRLTGFINWQRNRAKKFSPETLNSLTSHMLAANPDHTIITGDLVNLSLPFEIERARNWLNSLGNGEEISIVCGNHDAYIKDTLEQSIRSWHDYLVGDQQVKVVDNSSFPILRRRGPCALILVNSAVPTKPFDATGLFDQAQAERLEKILLETKSCFRIIAIHHPPFPNATVPAHRLIGEELFREVINKCGAELVLHGHTHRDTLNLIDGPNSQVPVICVPAGGQGIGGAKPAAHYNWFQIKSDGLDGKWSLTRSKFGYKTSHNSVALLEPPETL